MWSKSIKLFNPYEALKSCTKILTKKKNKIAFKIAVMKVKHSRRKLIWCYARIIKYCLSSIDEIGIPITDNECERLKEVLALYDSTMEEVNKSIDKYRKYVE